MGFYILTGVMGSGKSYMAAELCLDALKENAVVHTNLDLNWEEVDRLGFRENLVVLPENPLEWKSVIKGGAEGMENLLIVDEAALTFHVHDQQASKAVNREVFEMLVWSRRLGLDVYFISQSFENLDGQIRRMHELRIHCVNVGTVPFVGPFVKRFLGDFKRLRVSGKRVIASTYHRFNPAVGNFYKTHGMMGRTLGVEQSAQRVKKTSKDTRIAKIVLCLVLCAAGYSAYSVTHTKERLLALGGVDPSAPHASTGPAPAGAAPRVAGAPVIPGVEWERTAYRLPDMEAYGAIRDDEFLLAWVMQTGAGLKVGTEDGMVLEVGKEFDGDVVARLTQHAGRVYVETQSGRKVLVRPAQQHESKKRWSNTSQAGTTGSFAPLQASGLLPLAPSPALPTK